MLSYKAMIFARDAHKNHVRKYTGNPYSDHLAEVAGIAASAGLVDGISLAVCWLHDTIEDTAVTYNDLAAEFGICVADGVLLLSDLEVSNRAKRKAASCERLSRAPGWIQTIKCADLISNTSSIVKHDPKFAKMYLEEKRLLLNAMKDANPSLRKLAMIQGV